MNEFLKTIPREHWSGYFLYYERYCKGKSYKTAWYFYKKEYYRQQKIHREKNQKLIKKIGERYDREENLNLF